MTSKIELNHSNILFESKANLREKSRAGLHCLNGLRSDLHGNSLNYVKTFPSDAVSCLPAIGFVECCKGFHARTLHLVVEKVGPPRCFIKQLPIHYKAKFQSHQHHHRLRRQGEVSRPSGHSVLQFCHVTVCHSVSQCVTVCHSVSQCVTES